jgi:hypothetical protein
MEFMLDEKSSSSLLSDCTNGLVGALKTKLEEKEDEREGIRDRISSGSVWEENE